MTILYETVHLLFSLYSLFFLPFNPPAPETFLLNEDHVEAEALLSLYIGLS